jgi:hypothetical protein
MRAVPGGPRGLAFRLRTAVRHASHVQLAPWVWIALVLASVGVGVAIDAVSAVPWWAIALAGPLGARSAIWCFGLRRAFDRRMAVAAIRGAFRPKREAEYRLRALAPFIRDTALPLYAPETWPDSRWVSGHSASHGHGLTGITLTHDAGPGVLTVEVHNERWAAPGHVVLSVTQAGGTEAVALRVDGVATTFTIAFADDEPRWCAAAVVGDATVVVYGYDIDPSSVAAVRTSIEPYLPSRYRRANAG